MEKTKIDIISGFLGAGKTTLIKKLLKDAFQGEQVVLIENGKGQLYFCRKGSTIKNTVPGIMLSNTSLILSSSAIT